jgi:hypothetical protein
VLYYGGSKTTTYTSVGNGWYRLSATFSAVDAATATGLQVESGYTVYVDGFQLEIGAWASPLAYGDMPGCAWASTAHGSKTTRTEGRARLAFDSWHTGTDRYVAGVRHLPEFSIAFVWKTAVANTFATDVYLIDAGNVNFYFKASDDKFYLEDGTTTISSAAQTFAVGDILHLVIVAQPGEIRIYKNGVSIANNTSYDPVDPGYIYIGSDSNPDYQLPGTIQGCTIYDKGLTQAEVTAIYTAAAPLISAGIRVDYLPWQHTPAGDDYIQAQYDSSASDQDWRVFDGIPGDVPADTIMDINGSYGTDLTVNLNAVDEYMSMAATFKDCQGTAETGALNAEVDRSGSFTTSETEIPESSERISVKYPYQNYQEKQFYIAASIADNGTGLYARPKAKIGTVSYTGEWQALTGADTTLRFYLIGPLTSPRMFQGILRQYGPGALIVSLECKRTGTSTTADIDYYRVLFGKLCLIDSQYAVVNGPKAWYTATGDYYYITQPVLIRGDAIELEPNKINYMVTLPYAVGEDITATDISSATTGLIAWVTPRWSIV